MEEMYHQLQRRLVESGDWDRISTALRYKLNDECWTDSVRAQVTDRAKQDNLIIRDLLQYVANNHSSVPEYVKQEFLKIIRLHIEKEVQA